MQPSFSFMKSFDLLFVRNLTVATKLAGCWRRQTLVLCLPLKSFMHSLRKFNLVLLLLFQGKITISRNFVAFETGQLY